MSANSLAQQVGYSPRGHEVKGSQLLHNERILAAIAEVTTKGFRSSAALGRKVVEQIALNDRHPKQLQAAVALLDRGGFQVENIQKITVEKHDLTGRALIERIKVLADKHGLDATKLIGSNVIDGEFTEVQGRAVSLAEQPEHAQLLPQGRDADDDRGGGQAGGGA